MFWSVRAFAMLEPIKAAPLKPNLVLRWLGVFRAPYICIRFNEVRLPVNWSQDSSSSGRVCRPGSQSVTIVNINICRFLCQSLSLLTLTPVASSRCSSFCLFVFWWASPDMPMLSANPMDWTSSTEVHTSLIIHWRRISHFCPNSMVRFFNFNGITLLISVCRLLCRWNCSHFSRSWWEWIFLFRNPYDTGLNALFINMVWILLQW